MAGLEGQVLGGCRIIKRLGAGGMGQVYLAEQERLGREVALKVVRPPRSSGESDDGVVPTLADAPERFKLEARAIAALEHPNILPVHEFGAENGLMYLVMPLMPDGSLFDAMQSSGQHRRLHLPLTPTQAAPLLFQAASALQYAHQHNIIHRDVKPENFLVRVGRDGTLELFLADFGLVKEYHPGSDSRTLAVGTADYVAPEQIEGRPVPASDQYALGVMTYELLAGRLPFTGGVAEVALKHLRDDPPSIHRFNPAIPVEIEQVVLRALRKQPQERWPSVLEYARAYSEVLKMLEQRKQGSRPLEDEPTVHMVPSAPPLPSKPLASRPPDAYETQAVPLTPPAASQKSAPAGAVPAPAPPQPPRLPHNYPAQPRVQAGPPAGPPGSPPGAPPWAPAHPNGPGSAATWASAAPVMQSTGALARQRKASGLKWLLIVLGIIIALGLIGGVGAVFLLRGNQPTPAPCRPENSLRCQKTPEATEHASTSYSLHVGTSTVIVWVSSKQGPGKSPHPTFVPARVGGLRGAASSRAL